MGVVTALLGGPFFLYLLRREGEEGGRACLNPALVLERVSATYGREPVLREVDLEVDPRRDRRARRPERFRQDHAGPRGVPDAPALERPGPSGCGGEDLYAMSARDAARLVAVVPQDVVPAFSFTALELVLMGRSPYRTRWGGGGGRQDWAKVREAMAATQVQHLADRPVDELSGGERRRVVLAQALAQDAPVLMLDEPTTHLDVRHVLDLLAIVRRLAELEGTAVLAIHHDLNLAASTCDRLVALHEGPSSPRGPPRGRDTRRCSARSTGWRRTSSTDPATGRPSVRIGVPSEPAAPLGRRAHVVGGAGCGARRSCAGSPRRGTTSASACSMRRTPTRTWPSGSTSSG